MVLFTEYASENVLGFTGERGYLSLAKGTVEIIQVAASNF